MKWNELTLWQYQQLMPTITNPDKDWTELDAEVKRLCIVTGLTEYQIDSLSITALNELRKELDFLNEHIEGKPVNYIEVNKKRYRINYDIKNMPSARYIESKVFSKDTLPNLHKIAASMVIPQKRNWYGKWIDQDYDASKHEEYAADMQEANFVDIYHSLVFFLSSLQKLDRNFKGLYDSGDDSGGDDGEPSGYNGASFIRIYGWHYTCYLIAAQENIRVKEVFEMKTIEFLNAMAYMKAKNSYDREEAKRIR
jgi:hypothetical protein